MKLYSGAFFFLFIFSVFNNSFAQSELSEIPTGEGEVTQQDWCIPRSAPMDESSTSDKSLIDTGVSPECGNATPWPGKPSITLTGNKEAGNITASWTKPDHAEAGLRGQAFHLSC